MSDSFRVVGTSLTGATAADFKRHLKVERTKATATYTREGIRDELVTQVPSFADVFETIEGSNFYLVDADVEQLDGDGGRLTVNAVCIYPEITGAIDPIGPPQYEVHFQELRRKIEAHPAMGTLTTTAIAAGKSFENWQSLTTSDWNPKSSLPAFWASITPWSLDTYKGIKKKGTDEFLMYLPVVTRTLKYNGRPDGIGSNSGTKQSPPTGSYQYISLYDWLLGVDDLSQKGTQYERKTSWMAVDDVNTDIYPDGDA